MAWMKRMIREFPPGITASDTFTEQWVTYEDGDSVSLIDVYQNPNNAPTYTPSPLAKEWKTRTVMYVDVPKERALAWLSMIINQKEDDPDSFIDYTAKELAIKMVFDMSEKDASDFFKKLEEPLASRVLHYLIKLGVNRSYE